jgi:predicted nucleic acid-binding Zn ribbon protein
MGVIFKGSGFYTTDYKKSSAVTGGNGSAKEKSTEKSAEKPKESTEKKVSTEKSAAS